MKKSFLILTLVVLAGIASELKAQKTVFSRFGEGIKYTAPDTSMSIKFSTRFQTLFITEKSLEANSPYEKEMMIRRFRLKFDGFAFDPRLEYKIELALSNRDNAPANVRQFSNAANIVLDAVLKYAVRDNLELWFGQTKLPGNRERVISSQALQFVDRSLLNGYFNLDRDLGLQMHHKFNIGKVVIVDRYAVSLGQGRNVTATDTGGFSYTGRLEILPFGEFTRNGDYFDVDLMREPKPKLSLAAGYSFNDNAYRQGGELGDFVKETRDLQTFFADAMLKFRGWSLTSEYMNKQAHRSPILDDTSSYFQTGWAWNIQSGYLFKNNVEVAGRYTQLNPSEAIRTHGLDEGVNEYTLALSKYFKGHNLKIQTDFSYSTFSVSEDGLRFRLQVEMAL